MQLRLTVKTAIKACLLALFLSSLTNAAPALAGQPYRVAEGLFAASKPDLGLKAAPGTEHITVFAPSAQSDKFTNGVVPFVFRDRLYVQWQSSARDEDSPDTHTLYAVSADGVHFSAPRELSMPGRSMQTSGGWASDGTTLIAYLNLWPHGFRDAAGKHPGGTTLFRSSRNGKDWSAAKPVLGADGKPVPGIIEQDPHRYGTRLYTAFHLAPGLIVRPFYSDDPLGISGWQEGAMTNLPHTGDVSRGLEPSFFRQANGCLVMVLRDQSSGFHQLAAQSCDQGRHWSPPTPTNMPDARAKQAAGNLPDGSAFLINVPRTGKKRIPLAISLSRGGKVFDRAFLIRGEKDLPKRLYPGKYKRPGFHYPKATLWRAALWVGYAINKEEVALTRIPLNFLITPQTEHKH